VESIAVAWAARIDCTGRAEPLAPGGVESIAVAWATWTPTARAGAQPLAPGV
jgi:hypothetical protein